MSAADHARRPTHRPLPDPDLVRAARSATAGVLAVAFAVFACGYASAQTATPPAASQQPGGVVPQSDLERALAPTTRTRALRISPKNDAAADAAEPTAAPPTAAVALDIPFELNSSALRPEAVQQLGQLAAALRSESLSPFRFLIGGHTDASGDAGYNRRLSERRAESVRKALIERGVDADRLEARGFGEDQLLTPDRPNDRANRRVEIRNLGVTAR